MRHFLPSLAILLLAAPAALAKASEKPATLEAPAAGFSVGTPVAPVPEAVIPATSQISPTGSVSPEFSEAGKPTENYQTNKTDFNSETAVASKALLSGVQAELQAITDDEYRKTSGERLFQSRFQDLADRTASPAAPRIDDNQCPVTSDQCPAPTIPADSASAPAAEEHSDPMAQVTSVSQLADVQPGDWAFQALQNLVERYGCIAGYPDSSYRGNRALTRYEFAAGLNACISRISELIAAKKPTEDYVTKEDLAALQKLQADFAAELATLRDRVETLEARSGELEAQQFSTAAVLGGEVIFGLTGAAGRGAGGRGEKDVVLTQLARLGIVSTFTGKDRLRLELATGNFDGRGFASPDALNTDMALLSYQTGFQNQIQLDKLEYRFAAFGDRVVFTVRPVGFSLSSVLTANSPYFDAGRGAISRFAEASPIFKIGNLDAGVGFDWLVADTVRLQVAYGTRGSSTPERGQGVFGADHSALGAQLLVKPAANILAGVTYVNAYSSDGRLDTFTGSFNADTSGFLIQPEPAQINAVGGSLQWRLNPNVTLGTWGAWIFTDSLESSASATATTYLFSLGLSDPFGRQGDLLAFLFGQPPKLVSGNDVRLDKDTSLHFEVFYRFRVTDNISITPGFFIITNADHNAGNGDIFVGTIRTNFRF
jgi:hypothetical protein